MIAKLRDRHRRTWLVLAFLLPVALFLAWRVHRPPTFMDRLPPQLLGDPKR